MSRYQKGKTNPDFTEARDSEWQWQWHQLGQMQVCTSLQSRRPETDVLPLCHATNPLQRDNHKEKHPTTQFFTSRMPFLTPNQQHQSTEGRHQTLGNWMLKANQNKTKVTYAAKTKIICNTRYKHMGHHHLYHSLLCPRQGSGVLLRPCLSVCACLSASISPEIHVRSLPNFCCMLPTAVARSSSGSVTISYVLPVLWMTSYLHISHA